MENIETLVLVFHVLAALAIIGLVLIQHGKGADMGAGFGSGASTTVFGSGGAGNFLTRMTTVIAIAFFLTSFGLAYFAKERSLLASEVGIPQVVEQIAPGSLDQDDELPAFDDSYSEPQESEVPEG